MESKPQHYRLTPTAGLSPREGNPSCSSGDTKSSSGVLQAEEGSPDLGTGRPSTDLDSDSLMTLGSLHLLSRPQASLLTYESVRSHERRCQILTLTYELCHLRQPFDFGALLPFL